MTPTGTVLRDDGGHGRDGLLVRGGVRGESARTKSVFLVEVGDEERFHDIPSMAEKQIYPIRTPKGPLLWQCQLRIRIYVGKKRISTM